MDNRRSLLTVENSLYLVVFGLALALRLYHLNAHPLTDAEAREALIVYRLIRGQADVGLALSHSPAYFFFTYFAFLVFDASGAMARLAPALLGAGLVFLPALFRDRLGRAPALLASALLAISAGLVAASRSADGAIIALGGLGFGLGAFRRYLASNSTPWLIASAITLGLGLASGAAFLTGALILALTLLVSAWITPEDREPLRDAWARLRAQSTTFFITLGLTALVVATVGSVYRSGLGALAESWLTWLRGFAPSTPGRPPQTLLAFLLVYEPLLVVFGIVGAVRAFRTSQRFAQRLFWFGLVALGVVTLYSGRTAFDVIWVIAPLAALAGWALFDIAAAAWARGEWPLVAVQVGLTLVLFGFAGLNLASFAEQVRVNPNFSEGTFTFSGMSIPVSRLAYLYLAIASLLLVLVVSYLFGMGWSPRAARLGLTLGGCVALLALSLNAGWGLTQLRGNSPAELWWERPTADDVERLMETVGSVSNYAVGNEHDVPVTVEAAPDGALGWALRDFPHAQFVEALGADVNTPLVIAPMDEAKPAEAQNPQLGSAYVGQRFAFRYASAAGGRSGSDQIAWLVFRRAPVQAEHVILWVRQDVQLLHSASGK